MDLTKRLTDFLESIDLGNEEGGVTIIEKVKKNESGLVIETETGKLSVSFIKVVTEKKGPDSNEGTRKVDISIRSTIHKILNYEESGNIQDLLLVNNKKRRYSKEDIQKFEKFYREHVKIVNLICRLSEKGMPVKKAMLAYLLREEDLKMVKYFFKVNEKVINENNLLDLWNKCR